MKWATNWQQIDNKKDPILLESISQECSYINGFEYGGGGIRTHGALADTLVFKTRALNHSTTPPEGYSVVSEPKYHSIRR